MTSRRFRLALAGLVLIVGGCGEGAPEHQAATSGEAADRSGAGEDPAFTREEAAAATRHQTARFPQIDWLESKLTSWGEFLDASGDEVYTADRDTQVWAVAVSGRFRAGRAPSGVEPPEYPWGVAVYDAGTGDGLTIGGGPDGDWPAYFDRLTDQSGQRVVAQCGCRLEPDVRLCESDKDGLGGEAGWDAWLLGDAVGAGAGGNGRHPETPAPQEAAPPGGPGSVTEPGAARAWPVY